MAEDATTTVAPVYYVTKMEGFYYLRQTRFKAQYLAGQEHPHDVCGVARSKDELRGMVESCKLEGSVDWDFTQ